MEREEMTIEELKSIESNIPESDQMYFHEAISIMKSTSEITEMISLAFALGYEIGKKTHNNI